MAQKIYEKGDEQKSANGRNRSLEIFSGGFLNTFSTKRGFKHFSGFSA